MKAISRLTSGTIALRDSAQNGLTADLSADEREILAERRREGLNIIRIELTAMQIFERGVNFFNEGGTRKEQLLSVVEMVTGILKTGDPTDVDQAALLAKGLSGLSRSPISLSLLAATVASDQSSVDSVVNHLATSSALEYKGSTAWNKTTISETFGALADAFGNVKFSRDSAAGRAAERGFGAFQLSSLVCVKAETPP